METRVASRRCAARLTRKQIEFNIQRFPGQRALRPPPFDRAAASFPTFTTTTTTIISLVWNDIGENDEIQGNGEKCVRKCSLVAYIGKVLRISFRFFIFTENAAIWRNYVAL